MTAALRRFEYVRGQVGGDQIGVDGQHASPYSRGRAGRSPTAGTASTDAALSAAAVQGVVQHLVHFFFLLLRAVQFGVFHFVGEGRVVFVQIFQLNVVRTDFGPFQRGALVFVGFVFLPGVVFHFDADIDPFFMALPRRRGG